MNPVIFPMIFFVSLLSGGIGFTPSPFEGEGGGEGFRGLQSQGGWGLNEPPHPNPLPQGERGLDGYFATTSCVADFALIAFVDSAYISVSARLYSCGNTFTKCLRWFVQSSMMASATADPV